MKPVNLQGHSRPIKKVKFNENGEIIYTASSDRTIISWGIPKGEKLKTYAHSAAINTFCLTNKHLISGDNTGTIYFWDISTEKILKKLEFDTSSSIRSLDILNSDQSQLMIVYGGRVKNSKSYISIYNIEEILNFGEIKIEEKIPEIKQPLNYTSYTPSPSVFEQTNQSSNVGKANSFNCKQIPYAQNSIYTEENSIYSLYAKDPKPKANSNSNNNINNTTNNSPYKFNNPQANNNYPNNQINNNQNNNQNYMQGSLYSQNSIYNNNNNQNPNVNNKKNNFTQGSLNTQNSVYNNNSQTNNQPLKNTNSNFIPNPNNKNDPSRIVVSYEKILPLKQIESDEKSETKFVMAKFFNYNNDLCIAVSKEDGSLEFINYETTKKIHENKLHNEIIFDFDFDVDEKIFLTVSKDGTACVYDFEKCRTIKKFKPENPVRFLNTCKIYKLNTSQVQNIISSPEKNLNEKIKTINPEYLFSDILNLEKNENLEKNKNDGKDSIKSNDDKITNTKIINPEDLFSDNLNLEKKNIKLENDLNEGIKSINLNNNKTHTNIFIVAGGQDSKLVTTTKEGGFEIIGYHIDDENPIFSHLTNFGPVNTLDLCQKNSYIASGAEDSTVKLFPFELLLSNSTSNAKNFLFNLK